jgi:hypothetical protein
MRFRTVPRIPVAHVRHIKQEKALAKTAQRHRLQDQNFNGP